MGRKHRRKPGPHDWEVRMRRRARREKWVPHFVLFPWGHTILPSQNMQNHDELYGHKPEKP